MQVLLDQVTIMTDDKNIYWNYQRNSMRSKVKPTNIEDLFICIWLVCNADINSSEVNEQVDKLKKKISLKHPRMV